jgi:hypothetical protein
MVVPVLYCHLNVIFSSPIGGIIFGAVAIAAGIVYRAVMTSVHNFDVDISTVTKTFERPSMEDYWALIYVRPWARWPPYVTGILLGFAFFVIAKKKKSVRMPTVSKHHVYYRNYRNNTNNISKLISSFLVKICYFAYMVSGRLYTDIRYTRINYIFTAHIADLRSQNNANYQPITCWTACAMLQNHNMFRKGIWEKNKIKMNHFGFVIIIWLFINFYIDVLYMIWW